MMLRVMTGQEPPPVEQRMVAWVRGEADPIEAMLLGAVGYSERTREAVRGCLALDERVRTQSVGELLAALAGEAGSEAGDGPQGEVPRSRVGVRTVLLLGLGLGMGLLCWEQYQKQAEEEQKQNRIEQTKAEAARAAAVVSGRRRRGCAAAAVAGSGMDAERQRIRH